MIGIQGDHYVVKLPAFIQNKGKARLLASTQVHVLDNEANAVRIGQRVPIQTASLPSYTSVSNQTAKQAANQAGVGVNDLSLGLGGAFGVGIPQIQYENVGLNLDITPNVYEDDVQMKMKIESTSVDSSTGKFTPTFNQRTMTSVARVKDGQTTLVAGVSQNNQAKTVKGLPLIGLIPILGRFFATPETTDTQSDVVITAAVIPGKKSPVLVTEEMVKGMAPGSVIFDLAGERGGNCELTETGKAVVRHGVTIIGAINLASGVPYHASQMYARNLSAFLLHLVKDGKLRLVLEDEIIRETLVTNEGEVVNQRVREFFGLPALATVGS